MLRPRLTALIVTAGLLAACNADDPAVDATTDETATEPAGDPDGDEVEDEQAAEPAQPTSEEPPPAPVSDESCGDPATVVELGASVDGEVAGGEPAHYCVEVPPGQATVTFALTEQSDNVDMYVAYDTFEDLSGGLGMRFSDNNSTEDESLTWEPSAYRGELIGFDTYADVSPGPYWIELVGADATFVLTVTSEPV